MLVFGSVARWEPTEDSDSDLVATSTQLDTCAQNPRGCNESLGGPIRHRTLRAAASNSNPGATTRARRTCGLHRRSSLDSVS